MQREMRSTAYRAESCTENRLVRITCSTEAGSFAGSAAFGIGRSGIGNVPSCEVSSMAHSIRGLQGDQQVQELHVWSSLPAPTR